MAGATAATAAGVTASQANTITVNLLNNYISAAGGNHLNADLPGDGQPDLTIANAAYGIFYGTLSTGYRYIRSASARAALNGVLASAYLNHYPFVFFRIGSQFTGGSFPYWPSSLTGSIPISFQDLHINSGRLTHGSLNVTASLDGFPKVQLDSFTYNTPDQGSTLALLAVGASGVLAFRRFRAARGRT